MRHFLPLIVLAIVAACANIHPVKTVGADAYQLTHIMGASQSNAGARNALVKLGQKHCAEESSGVYSTLSEDIAVSGKRHTITLRFTCKPVLQGTAYVPSTVAPTPATTYTAPVNLSPEELHMLSTIKPQLQVPAAVSTTETAQ